MQLGPVTKPSRKSVNGISGHDNVREAFSRPPPNERISEPTSEEDEDGEEKHESADEDGVDDASGDSGDSGDGVQKPSGQPQKKRLSVEAEGRDESGPSKKRKRKHLDDDLEEQYLQRLAREEARETAKRNDKRDSKRQKTSDQPEPAEVEAEVQESEDSDRVDDAAPPPQHEILSGQSADVEKAARTVFLGNVSTTAITSKSAYKTLLAHLSSHLSSLASRTPPYKVESLRFRSTPFANALPKRAAFAKQELMDATTKSTNAYAVYKTKEGARDAAKHLNGTVVLDRHLRVDEVAHPAKTDNRRCVFVGNLGFVDDGSNMQEAEDEEGEKKRKRKQKEPGDVEEGLWREFGKAGTVESVRVIRDPKTRVGKGIAYVQFTVRPVSLFSGGESYD